MGNGISQKQKQRGMRNGAHTCKYLVNWINYTKRDLNQKWTNWGSFDIPKFVFLHAQLEKTGHALTGI